MDSGYSKWRKLDDAALAFPLVTGKDDTRVFRFYCELKEPVEEATLQAALDETMKRYPLFQAVLRKGLFWFYLERERDPCLSYIRKKSRHAAGSIFRIRSRCCLRSAIIRTGSILEVFHGLTDGTGAMHFLVELVQNYLILRHPAERLPKSGAGGSGHTRRSGGGQLFTVLFSRSFRVAGKKSRMRSELARGEAGA